MMSLCKLADKTMQVETKTISNYHIYTVNLTKILILIKKHYKLKLY